MKKILLLLVGLGIIGLVVWNSRSDRLLHIIICDVGQGDAIVIKSPNGNISVIDGGPDNSVLSCLGKHSPYFTHSIQSVMLTHLHADHIVGAIQIFKRYKVGTVVLDSIDQNTPEVVELNKVLREKKLNIAEIKEGMTLHFDNEVNGKVFWPTESAWNHANGQWQAYLYDFNDSSLVLSIKYKSSLFVFTGDAGKRVLDQVAESESFKNQVKNTTRHILKVPHHGSTDGISEKFLETLKPQLALISVGADNQFGHPGSETLKVLAKYQSRILRTDTNGDIEVTADDTHVWYKTQRK